MEYKPFEQGCNFTSVEFRSEYDDNWLSYYLQLKDNFLYLLNEN